ncbi:Fur family transcriptional regulator, ferric uptake regulator [Lachnospiraceae bacterium RM5]|nr:Fur family transcriptional regulator, ferric uptake regulator [Lachnospiraceae bacterium RM5]
MDSKSKYKTKQRTLLLEYFENLEKDHVTAADVYLYFKENDIKIGQATVYRQLEQMVDEGILNKYTIDANTPACFEYIEKAKCHDDICFHSKCEKCGKLMHLHCDELKEIKKHLEKKHGFFLNTQRTVFYGVCEECSEKNFNEKC